MSNTFYPSSCCDVPPSPSHLGIVFAKPKQQEAKSSGVHCARVAQVLLPNSPLSYVVNVL